MWDDIKFKPFTSVVIVLLGESQTPADPAPTGALALANGILDFAIQEYQESGRDVYMYDEDDVSPTDASGPAYSNIVDAINRRGVTDISMVGYSHGAGKIDILASRLNANKIPGSGVNDISSPFFVPFTAYIDGVLARFELDNTSITTPPVLSLYHINQYQRNTIVLGLRGASIPQSNIDTDQTGLGGMNHWSIVNSSIVLNLIRQRFRLKTNR